MDDSAFTSDAAAMDRRSLPEQLAIIRSLFHKESSDDDDATAAARNRNVVEGRAREGVRLINDQMAAVSTELLLTVMSDMMLLRLLDGLRLEEGRAVSSDASSPDEQQVMDDAAAAKKRKKAAAKKKRNKRNKAAAKHKKTNLMSWLSGGIISVIMMVAFSFITTPIVTFSLIQPSDGSGEGNAPPALPPSASKSLRQEDLKSNNEASSSPADIIISPLAAVVPPPVFAPTALSNRRMKSHKMRASTCFDTPNWEDEWGRGCDDHEECNDLCRFAHITAGDMGPASTHCCICDGGSTTCEDFRSKCQKYINVLDLGFNESGLVAPLCEKAESCSCEEAADHDVKIVTNDYYGWKKTAGLYNECKCDFWSRLCKDTGEGGACDYAAEYCCGDYGYDNYTLYGGQGFFFYLNSPTCYCDFFTYAQEELGHTLKPKALNISKEFDSASACGLDFDDAMIDMCLSDYSLTFERPSLEAIFNKTDGQNWKDSSGWMNEPDHCQWHGITCDGDGFVTRIDLRDNNLSGQFPVYSRVEFDGSPITIWIHSEWMLAKYGLANFYNLKTLDLADNKLTGTINYLPLYNLYSLTHFDVSGNQLSGDVDALVSPSLTYVDFSNNRFSSMTRFVQYKVSPLQTLRFCDVSNNAIENEASGLLENIPPNIEQFLASNNQMHGNLPASLNSLPKLSQFDMSSNALSGSLPDFTDSILSLQQLDLSNQKNGFTGSIPKDLWRFQSLKVLNLASNKIAGHIPPDIGKMAALEEFDLSNNRLVYTIPSELGQLAGSLHFLGLANNTLSGDIPSEIGQLQGATVLLKGNNFYDSSKTAPLSLCTMRRVKQFDLANTELCPVERNALSDFYYSTKGAEWTNDKNWLDEYKSYCKWHGVTCDEDEAHVTNLTLTNNGLSGRLNESIGDLTFMEVLDLSDNDIKPSPNNDALLVLNSHSQGSIPAEIGLLSNLTYLRLSYNAFTGTAEGLSELTKLQLLQLQSNRITGMPNMTQLDKSEYSESTFVTDCGVPSAFDETPECENCTMCCNANDDCHPTEKLNIAKFGYGNVAAVFFACFIVICFAVALSLYLLGKRKNRGNTLTVSAERRLEEDDTYALSRIGKESVYSYFVTEKPLGWLAAFATLGIQVAILAFFVMASEANLQKETIDIQFTWKCPRDSNVCKDKADLTEAGWIIFSMLMLAFLAKDIINGCKLIYHSSKVSTVYNKAIATSNTDIIVNSVIVLFIMEIDEYIFAALEASNKKWTAHAEESEDSSLVTEVSEMKEKFELQRAQIESQQEQIDNQQEQINGQQEELKMLREMVEKIQESQAAAAAAAAALTTSDSESAGVECEGSTNVQVQQMEQADQIAMPCEAEENTQESKAAAAASDLESEV
eukprot:scaffold4396_cov127-Skeletonema_dohrnii-CCMP3373.AAC.6